MKTKTDILLHSSISIHTNNYELLLAIFFSFGLFQNLTGYWGLPVVGLCFLSVRARECQSKVTSFWTRVEFCRIRSKPSTKNALGICRVQNRQIYRDRETPVLWPPDVKSWLIWKDPDAGKDWGKEEKGTTKDEMVGWHHRHNGHGFGWTPGVGDGQGGLVCCDSWGRKESDTTERLNWAELTETGSRFMFA